jgi:nitrite reductase/ring-hydroxylating ferredoxin subunit
MKTRVAALADLAPDKPMLVTVGGEPVLLARRGDDILAIGDTCPHQGGSLSEGWLEGDIAVCPLHGWEFDLRSGHCMTIPGEQVPCYRVTVENGEIHLKAPE